MPKLKPSEEEAEARLKKAEAKREMRKLKRKALEQTP